MRMYAEFAVLQCCIDVIDSFVVLDSLDMSVDSDPV